jgi:hypothetical protein
MGSHGAFAGVGAPNSSGLAVAFWPERPSQLYSQRQLFGAQRTCPARRKRREREQTVGLDGVV